MLLTVERVKIQSGSFLVSARTRYQGLFFVGIALVIVLLPFPNVFGVLLDAGILALAYPVIGRKASLLMVFIYNFNPVKLNGVVTVYYVLYAGLERLLGLPEFSGEDALVGLLVISLLVVGTVLEFVVIGGASKRIWDSLTSHDPRMRSLANPAEF